MEYRKNIEKINSFKDLVAWQEGHEFVLMVYNATKTFPNEETFGLTSQMRRAAVSVTSNIAEGFSRQSFKEKTQFYSIAAGSITEIQNQLEIVKDVKYLSENKYRELYDQSIKVHKILNGLIRSSRSRCLPNFKSRIPCPILHILFFLILYSIFYIPNSVSAATINKPANFLTLNTGLVGWWTFDGPRMLTNVADSSPNGLNAYISGQTSTTTVIGKIGQGLSFDGVNDKVVVTHATAFDLTDFTYSVWINKRVGSGWRTVMDINSDGQSLVFSGDTLYIYGRCGAHAVTTVTSGSGWHHLAWKVSGSDYYVYKDSVQVATGGGCSASINGSVFNVGHWINSQWLNATLDDIRIYSRALSAGEIKQLYNIGAKTKISFTPKGLPNEGFNSGLVGWWTFDGPRMLTNVADSSGQGNNGSLIHGGSGTTTAPGPIGQALRWDGVNDYAQATINSYTTMTISAWIRIDGTGNCGYYSIVDYGNADNPYFGTNGGACTLGVYNGGWIVSSAANAVLRRKLKHVVFTSDAASNVSKIYVDGVQSGSNGTAMVNTGTWMRMGIGSGENAWAGIIDDVRIYNRALTAGEITQLYNLGSAKFAVSPTLPLTSGLVGYWTFDGKDTPWTSATAATTIDKSGNGNTGTLTNMAQATSPVAGKIGQGLKFDGVNDRVTAAGVSNTPAQFSLIAWAKPGVVPADKGIAGAWSTNNGYMIWLNSSNQASCPINAGTHLSGTTALKANVWYQLICTYDGTNVRVYVNGILEGSQAKSAPVSSGTAFEVGAYGGGLSGKFLNGSLDDVRIYNRVLSAGEIKQLYNLGR